MKRLLFLGFMLTLVVNLTAQLHYTNEDLPCVNKTFKVHFHLVQDSLGNVPVNKEQIEQACAQASQKFAPICMKFELCEIDTIINYNYDSLMLTSEYFELAEKYAYKNRINVFISSITYKEGPPGVMDFPICGLGGSHIWLSCMPAFAHELGHFFGLPHTFEGEGVENVDGSNCETHGDRICDTPADPFVEHNPTSDYINSDCEFIGTMLDANGQFYQPQTGNIMSYYGCSCQEFTRGQFLKMIDTYNTQYKKHW